MVLFVMLYKVNLIFKTVDEILKSVTIQMKATEQHPCGTVCYAVQGESNL